MLQVGGGGEEEEEEEEDPSSVQIVSSVIYNSCHVWQNQLSFQNTVPAFC
jgi:hypothetical protein